jgi:hypothetical protein
VLGVAVGAGSWEGNEGKVRASFDASRRLLTPGFPRQVFAKTKETYLIQVPFGPVMKGASSSMDEGVLSAVSLNLKTKPCLSLKTE